MPFVPLPFVVALSLFILLWVVASRQDEAAPNLPFLALILVAALQSVLTGLRWGYGISEVGYIAPVSAAIMPSLLYAGVSSLVRTSDRRWPALLGLHATPAVIIIMLIIFWREAIDVALTSIDFTYAAAILWLLRSGADGLRLAPFDGAVPVYRAILFAAATLCLSGAVDMLVSFDLASGHGARAATVIGIGNLFMLVIVGMAAAAASQSHVPLNAAEPVETSSPPDAGENADAIARVNELMQEKKLYRDANLNLNRLARRAGIPARQISMAINRATARNVSQYVNGHRITEACRLLSETDQSVTEIMFAVGFQTKSNFNREFRRVTDMTPLAWRDRNAPDAAPSLANRRAAEIGSAVPH
ncbi:AraC family transcriptional regulator [Mesorhizobium sp. M7A.F.Ca.US.014.04.1.1]|uniref:helix-turn-helix domain-containing protein n=2 Tax=Phyllobacteriaceae TaxID=69277 RepID=UPI0007A93CB2|nr:MULTISPECIES: AraC family transcriptional regulator [Mesorhizobium]AMX94125.1 AraC family transcriptional regulator [Mesorhizobium ciceri]MDF3208886.1 AraC family transcriptional regulator [Mesorhizobium sp. LMG15046]MDF3228542.1 AraC family transcriptional regulator [Mesorhizobium sp. DSM 30133]RUU20119.1 AraC family transcriptional regulator [Mesorhizobium sp. Primo-B]RUU36693.1 AraC family transcriptional regulator [Mesorhizobium sp. Primo-A]